MSLAGRIALGAVSRSGERSVLLHQVLLAAVVLLGVMLTLPFDETLRTVELVSGTLILFLATGTAVGVPWSKAPAGTMLILPVADIVSIGLLDAALPAAGLEVVWFFPAMWMASMLGGLGVALSVALIAVANAAVHFVISRSGLDASDLLLPLAIGGVAGISALTGARAAAQRRVLERQSRFLQLTGDRSRRQEDLVTAVLDAVDFGVTRLSTAGDVVVSNEAHVRMQQRGPAWAPAYAADGVTPLSEDRLPLARAQRGEVFEGELVWFGDPGADARMALLSTSRRSPRSRGGDDGGLVVVTRDVSVEETVLRVRDDLIASVSHELRTPLTSLTGYIDLAMEDAALSDETRRYLDISQRSAERLLVIVEDLVTASEMAQSEVRLSLSRRRTDLAALMRAAAEAMAPRARERAVVIDLDAVHAAVADVDADRIRQVFDNLLSNAVKYNRDGGRVEVEISVDGDARIVIVRDNGYGISEIDLPHVFERFFRSAQVRNSTVHGSGLGLAISREIVMAHGGSISVQSQSGAGTAFRVRLPAGDPEGDQ